MKIRDYKDLEKLTNRSGKILIDITTCSTSLRKRVIDFIAGLTLNNGKIIKINKNTFEIILER